MNNKGLIISSGIAVVTILFVVAYSLFNVFGVTQSRVVRNELTIVTGSSEKLYDGTPLSNDEWYIESGSLYEGDTLETIMGTSITNPSSVDNEIGVTILDSEGKNVTINYKIHYKLGTLTVRPIELTIRTEGSSKYFDGSPLTHQVWRMQFGELFDGHRLEYEMNSKITAPGTTDNEIDITILDKNDEVVNHIYDITYHLGSLTVYGRDITISTETYEKGYDGTPLLGGPVIQTGEIAFSNTIVFGPEPKLTNPGTVSNERSVIIYDSEGNDITEYYNITYDFGTLTVHPIELIIRSDSATKVYDGTPLSNDQWDLVHGQVLDGHELVVDVNNEITEVGIIDNTIFATILDERGTDVSYIYNIEYITGTLEVVGRDLIISTVSDSKFFDGTPLTSDGYTIEMGQLADNHRIEYHMASSITNPGEIDNEITLMIINENDEIVTNDYNIEYMLGTLTVLTKEITISTETLDKRYDGTPLLGGTGTLIFGELTEGHTIVYGPGNSIVNPGIKLNEIEAIIYDSDGTDVTMGYDITYEYGTLTIHAISLIIKSPDDSKTYDGTPLSNNTWELINGTLLEGHELIVDVDNSITDVGSIKNVMNPYVIDETGNDLSDMYDIEQLTGTLTVHGIEITITTETLEKGYDGTPLLGGSGTLQYGSLLDGHYIEYGPEQSITNPGSITNTVDVRVFDSEGTDVTQGYEITYEYGTLTITPVSIVVKSPDDTKIYDGTPLSNNTWEFFSGTLLDNHTLVVEVDNEITNSGSVPNTMDAYVIDELGNNVSDIYDIEHITGRLTVTKRDITIQTDDYDKPYDGTPLLGGTGTIVGGTLVENHTVSYGPEQSITYPDTIENEIGVTFYDGDGNDVTTNYNIIDDFGTLTIHPITLILTSDDDSKTYDGTPLTNNNWDLLSGTLLPGHTLVVDVSNQITNPGTIENTIVAYVVDESDHDVSDSYDLEYVPGDLTIDPINITISTATSEKAYDGTPLLGGNGTLTAGSLVPTHSISYGPEQSITNPGVVENSIDITIFDGSGNDVTIGYNITENFGTLTIDEITIILKSPDATKIYDGTPLSANTYEVLSGSVLAGHTLYVDVDNEITDVGSIDNTMFAYVLDGSGNSVTHYYSFLYNVGTLTVLSSAYSSNEIATESFDIPEQDVFRVYAGVSGLVYFKDRSHGDYNYTGWTPGVVQNTNITNNPLSFPSTALAETGRTSTQISVEYLRDQVPYLSPYYTVDTISGLNDIHITGDTSITNNINIIMYNYDEADGITIQDELLSSEEQTYRNYVYANYLDIPADTLSEMLLIAQANGLSAESPTIIADVQNYIKNAATYNLDFAPIPEGEDVAVYFLNVSKEGICQHYATAATLMYRSLGVPARYVTGFVGNLDANQWTTVDSKQAHAWVEVYIDGLGWVPVEVTGSGSASEPIEPIEITVIPNTVRELYEEGKTITASSLTILGYTDFFNDGYTYQATYGGSLSTIGTASSTVSSMTIYDSEGKDVTNQFAITFMEGVLQLYGYEIELVTSNDTKIYDGTPLTNTTYLINGSLATGHHVESVIFTGSQTNLGVSKNTATVIIHDENGNNVTSLYSVDYTYGDLTVTPRSITIESADATKVFDGTPLTSDSYLVTSGSLASTDTIEIDITGSQTMIGKSMNTISSITILNNGNNVTSNYIIVTVEGELIVTPY